MPSPRTATSSYWISITYHSSILSYINLQLRLRWCQAGHARRHCAVHRLVHDG